MLNWKKSTYNKDSNSYVLPNNWLHIHYYEALVILFRIENAMRIFVYSVLKSEFKNNWAQQPVFSPERTIQIIAEERIRRDNELGYIGYNISCPIMQLTLGELVYIIFNNWTLFEEYFTGHKNIMKYKLDEITNVRNNLAHFRPIQEGDVDLINQTSKHVLTNIDNFISDMINCYNNVPTNTTDNWYKKIIDLIKYNETEYHNYCTFTITEDVNQKWITIKLKYKCQVTSWQDFNENVKYYHLTNFNSSNMIKKTPRILKYSTFISEDAYGRPESISDKNSKLNTPYSKTINFSFKHETIENDYNEIYHDFYKIIKLLFEETNMVISDNKTRGSIIYYTSLLIDRIKDEDGELRWKMNSDSLLLGVQKGDPPEFWGHFNSTNNFITNAHNYPWMGADISNVSGWSE